MPATSTPTQAGAGPAGDGPTTRIKVCGITERAEIDLLAAQAVDFVGLWYGVPGGPADLPLSDWRELATAAGATEHLAPVMVTFLKDVEALHPTNAGLLSLGMPRFIPSTPAAAFHMLDRHTRAMGRDPEVAYDGVDLVLVGRSNNVGKPAAILGLQRNATVISAHKHTADAERLEHHTCSADVLIVAVGVPHLIRGDMIKEGAIVIDIGINATEGPAGKVVLTGDVDTETVEPVAEAVSPVPGGVGPITDVWVLRNTVNAARIAEPPAR